MATRFWKAATVAALAAVLLAGTPPAPAGAHATRGGATDTVEHASPLTDLPVRYADGRILVPVTVAGVGERLFILDTAAGKSVISTRLRALLTLDSAAVRKDTVIGASGRTVMEFVTLDDLAVGELEHPEQWAVVADISAFNESEGRPIDGILGVDILRLYDVELDLPGRRLRLFAHGAPAPRWAHSSQPVPFHSSAQPGFIQFEASVAGTPVDAILDTGARAAILNWHAAALAGLSPTSEGVREKTDGSRGIDGRGTPSHWAAVDEVDVAGRPLPDGEQKIADLPVFRVIGLDTGPTLLLGARFLESCSLWVSYDARELRFCSSG